MRELRRDASLRRELFPVLRAAMPRLVLLPPQLRDRGLQQRIDPLQQGRPRRRRPLLRAR